MRKKNRKTREKERETDMEGHRAKYEIKVQIEQQTLTKNMRAILYHEIPCTRYALCDALAAGDDTNGMIHRTKP